MQSFFIFIFYENVAVANLQQNDISNVYYTYNFYSHQYYCFYHTNGKQTSINESHTLLLQLFAKRIYVVSTTG